MKVKSKLQLAPDEKKLGKVDTTKNSKWYLKKNADIEKMSDAQFEQRVLNNKLSDFDLQLRKSYKNRIKAQANKGKYNNEDWSKFESKRLGSNKQTKSKNYSINVKPKPKTSYHKDIKSHNVNIRVISGINGNLISDIKDKLDLLNKWNKVLEKLNSDLKSPTVPKWQKTLLRNDIYRVKSVIKDLKTDISKTQKKVK